MKLIKFLLNHPFYTGYIVIMGVAIAALIFNIGGTLDGFISAPLVVQIVGSLGMIGGSIACGISLVQTYKAGT
jgi:hypothetical protein